MLLTKVLPQTPRQADPTSFEQVSATGATLSPLPMTVTPVHDHRDHWHPPVFLFFNRVVGNGDDVSVSALLVVVVPVGRVSAKLNLVADFRLLGDRMVARLPLRLALPVAVPGASGDTSAVPVVPANLVVETPLPKNVIVLLPAFESGT